GLAGHYVGDRRHRSAAAAAATATATAPATRAASSTAAPAELGRHVAGRGLELLHLGGREGAVVDPKLVDGARELEHGPKAAERRVAHGEVGVPRRVVDRAAGRRAGADLAP